MKSRFSLLGRRETSLDAAQAHTLRNALGRLAAGDRLPRTGDLPAALADALANVERRLREADHLTRAVGERLDRPLHAVLVGVDRLAGIRLLGAELAEGLEARLVARILDILPEAVLRRTGRDTLEFVFECDPAEARTRLKALHTALEARLEVDGKVFDLPVAIGFARAPPGTGLDEALIEAAEHALARARAEHRQVAEFDEAARAQRSDELALMRDLRAALDTDAVHLCYQPKLDARTGAIIAAEALIRWRHPERGMVPPDVFIGLAEQTGEIRHITERVLRRAISDQALMRAAGVEVDVAVNVSGGLFCDDRFTAWALERIGQAAGVIGLEITETAVIGDPQKAIAHMKAFAAAGVPIAIDDYGSGLSSLAYLKQLPAHELKIDKCFISGLTSSHRDPLIVRSTIELAHALDMKVTAEGVDSPTARALLTVMGCDLIQGYDISPPLTPQAFIDFVQRHEMSEVAASAPRSRGAAGVG